MPKHYDFERVGRDDNFGIFEVGARAHYIAACQDCREAERIVRALNFWESSSELSRTMFDELPRSGLVPPSLNEGGRSSPNP